MDPDDVCFYSIQELSEQFDSGELTPLEVTNLFLDRIDALNDRLNAYRVVFEEEARATAREATEALAAGTRFGPLHGIPVAIKDNANVAGESTPAGWKPLLERNASHDSYVVERLRDAGAVLLGKTHIPELSTAVTDQSWGAPTSTPFDLSRNAGGSSGGSAAAVAAGLATVALGTDGGGSIRIPASCCGVVGVKPSFRRVPVPSDGHRDKFTRVTPFSEFGPLARTVRDAAVMLEVMIGPHPSDVFAAPDDGTACVAASEAVVSDITIGYSPDLGVFPVTEEVSSVVSEAVDSLPDDVDVEPIEVDFGHDRASIIETWNLWSCVSKAKTARQLGESGMDLLGEYRDDLHPHLVEQMEAGADVSAVDYVMTNIVRTDILDTFVQLFEEYELVVSPTLSIPPVTNADDDLTIGPAEVAGEAVDPHLGWCLTSPLNFSGHPAASVPAGFTHDGLPIGVQIIGPRYDEETVIGACALFEHIIPWDDTYPVNLP